MPNRTSPRHPDFDDRTSAAYVVTVCALSDAKKCPQGCAHDRRCFFGRIERGRMPLNEIGRIGTDEWERSEKMREEMILDAFIVMPTAIASNGCLVRKALSSPV
jgi:hypothetical protein